MYFDLSLNKFLLSSLFVCYFKSYVFHYYHIFLFSFFLFNDWAESVKLTATEGDKIRSYFEVLYCKINADDSVKPYKNENMPT